MADRDPEGVRRSVLGSAHLFELSELEEWLLADLEPVTEVGEGIKVAAVKDPFGNRLGIIENPHFKASEAR